MIDFDEPLPPMRFREAREQAGFTIYSAARELGVAPSTVKSWDEGTTMPSAEKVFDMAILYEVSSDWLLALDTMLEDGDGGTEEEDPES